MTMTFKAVYRGGNLRPATPLSIAEGAEVEVTVTTTEQAAIPSIDARTAAQMLSEIAAMPQEGTEDRFCGADHDAVLYAYDAHLPKKHS